jgi:hypothetical protein
MSEIKFTPKIFEQTDLVQEECRKLQALLNDKVPDTSFIWALDDMVIMLSDLFRKRKRTRKKNVAEEGEEDVEVKPKHNVIFKVDGSQTPQSFLPESLIDSKVQGSQTLEPVTWGSEPQSPWSQRVEQNSVVVPLNLDLVQLPGMYSFVTFTLLYNFL